MLQYLINLYQRHAARRMFSRWSPIYEEEVTENCYSAADEVADTALDLLEELKNTNFRVLDIGIGTGLVAQQIASAYECEITGLDFNEEMLALCSQKDAAQYLFKCDVGRDRWPADDMDYDLAVSAGLGEYLTENMMEHFLDESARVLKQHGMLVFSYIPAVGKKNTLNFWNGHSGSYLTSSYVPTYLEKKLAQKGFSLLHHKEPFRGCLFQDGSSYDYRLIAAKKAA